MSAVTDNKKPDDKASAPKSGVGKLNLSGLLKSPQEASTGKPIIVPLSLIDEDPLQPRGADNPGFTPESIAELGQAIKNRGVKTPISVRDNPDTSGRYVINDGARRFRASKWAEKNEIPVFIDNDFIPDDQVVANLQREGHTAWEIAQLISKRLASGMKKGEIAKAWGKSGAYITQHAALLDLPPVIALAFDKGRINDVTLVNELVTAHKKKPHEVADWLANETQEITRGSVKLLREFLDEDPNRDPRTIDAFTGHSDDENEEGADDGAGGKPKKKPKEQDPEKFRKAIVQVEVNGDLCRILLTKRPSEAGMAWFKNEVSGEEFEADIASAVLKALVEG
jgi:ParB family chromosome partitioning protein